MSDINIKINVDNKAGITAVDQLDKSVDNLSSSIVNLDDVVTSGFSEMDKTIEGAGDSYDDLANKTNKASDAQDKLEKSSANASKGFGVLKKGVGALGTAFKATGIIALFAALWKVMKENQAIMDAIETVTTAVSIVFKQLSDVVVNVWNSVSEATGGFDAMKEVIGGLLKIAITPLKLSFYGIKAAVLGAQLAWEQSIFGGKDADKIKSLTADIEESKEQIKQAGLEAVEAGNQIGNNFVEAIGEVTTLAKTAYEQTTETIKGITLESIHETAKSLVDSKNKIRELDAALVKIQETADLNAEQQRQIRDDENALYSDRIAASEELANILAKQSLDEKAILSEKLKIAEVELATNKTNIELQANVLDAKNELIAVDAKIAGFRSEQLTSETSLVGDEKAKQLEIVETNQEIIDQIYGESRQNKLDNDLRAAEIDIENSTMSEEEKASALLELNEEYLYNLNELKLEKEKEILEQLVEASALSEEEKAAALIEIDEQYKNDVEDLNRERVKNKEKADDDELKSDEEKTKQLKENAKDVLSVLSQLSSIYSQINSNRLAEELSETEATHAAELENFKGTEEEREQLIKDQKNEIAQIEYEQALANKQQKVIDATIEGGLAILASISQLGPIAGPIVGGALVATNLGLILSQDVPPPVRLARGGILSGPSHADGGIATPFGEVEGDEGIINKTSMSNPSLRNIASAVNVAGGGVDFGTGSGAIELSPVSIAAITEGINNKKVFLNTNELTESNDSVDLIDNESTL